MGSKLHPSRALFQICFITVIMIHMRNPCFTRRPAQDKLLQLPFTYLGFDPTVSISSALLPEHHELSHHGGINKATSSAMASVVTRSHRSILRSSGAFP